MKMNMFKKFITALKTIILIVWFVLSIANLQQFDMPYKNLLIFSYGAILILGFLYEIDKHIIRKKISEKQVNNIVCWGVLIFSTFINIYYWKATIYMLSYFLINIGFDIKI